MIRVHQILSSAGPYDAISEQALTWRRLLERRGMAGGLYADSIDRRVRRRFRPLRELSATLDDLLVIRYSAYRARFAPVLELPQRKLLVYHNVTPPRYYWNHHVGVAVACAVGRERLPAFVRAATVTTADSRFNARDLEGAGAHEIRIVPILFEPDRLRAQGRPAGRRAGPLVLVVGRLVPNKRHDLVLAVFAAYQRARAPDARLLLVGEPVSPSYGQLVERLARETGARGVTIAGGLSQAQLNAAYAEADVLLSMSEHEGFCVPLLEAFQLGVPVVARPAGAVPEVGGDAVLWTDEPVETAVTAELLDLAVRDHALRTELARRGRERLEELSYERTAAKVVDALEATLA